MPDLPLVHETIECGDNRRVEILVESCRGKLRGFFDIGEGWTTVGFQCGAEQFMAISEAANLAAEAIRNASGRQGGLP